MRVLFTSNPGIGHIHPMLPLALALAGRGHEVRWAVAADVVDRLRAAGLQTFPAGLAGAERQEKFRLCLAATMSLPVDQRPDLMFPTFFGGACAGPMLDDLLPMVDEWRPAVVVHDASELAGPIVAAQHGIPHVCHAFGALLPGQRLAAAAAVVAPLWEAQGLAPRPYCGSYDHLYLDIYPPSMRLGPYDHVPRVQALRPVPFDAVGGEAVAPVVGGDRPLVYLTFGTVFNDPGLFGAAMAGLAGLDIEVLVTVGPAADPAAVGDVAPNVRVEKYVPQATVLPHCAVVVSHAGSGTFLAAFGLGIPQLCLPQAADQFLNARQGAASGAAITLLPGEVTADAVAEAVGRLLGDPTFLAAAGRIRAEIDAMPAPDEVAAVLEDLV